MKKLVFALALITTALNGLTTALAQPPTETEEVVSASDQKEPKAEADAESKESNEAIIQRKEKPLTIQGVFEAVTSWELVHEADQISSLEIERIVPHGSPVTEGQTVVWFDAEAIDRQLATAEVDLKLAQLTAADDDFAYEQFLETQKLDRGAAERARKSARQAYDNYVKVDREREIIDAEFSVKSAKSSLENAMEELEQLTQMYEEDDLTEESEEIVLKRAKQSVEFAEYRLESTSLRSERTVDQGIPKKDADEEDKLAKAEMAYEKAMRDLESTKKKRDLERKRAADDLAKKEADFEKLREQRKSITMKTPGDGILLHGELTRGALAAKPSTLEAGSKVAQDQVIATIASPKKLVVRLDVAEKDVAALAKDTACVVKPSAMPDTKIEGVVKSVASVPYAAGKFDAVIQLNGKVPAAVVPTMTATVEFETKP